MKKTPPRVVIEHIQPSVEAGHFPVKRTIGETLTLTADIFTDGQDTLAAVLQVRAPGKTEWTETAMRSLPNDRWTAALTVSELGLYEYAIEAWIDSFETWRQALAKKFDAKLDVSSDLLEGAVEVKKAAQRTEGADARILEEWASELKKTGTPAKSMSIALGDTLKTMMRQHPDRTNTSKTGPLQVLVERERARFGSWYEMFPRSSGKDPQKSATFRDAAKRLPEISGMGFDILYLPPVHPIGKSFRKGPNNAVKAGPNDPGSPWAIGSEEGGHKAIHPGLGTLADFDQFVSSAQKSHLEIALDLAFQCSPDHPYVGEHPEWFRHRPDGTIKYAENPPKKYEDIYPLDFECSAWEALWNELRDVVLFWIGHGVTIFRADNPHTKPFRFWEWLIREVRQKHPEAIFLAEAFTRPNVMAQLAKCGFSQSYSYFTWRNTKPELTAYFTELSQTPVREFMRPNLFINTPDIFHDYLQTGGRPAFQIRLFLAATLGASYGIYGPAYELCEARAFPGTEDYQDSEKYQIRVWDRDRPGHIKEWVTLVNRIRHENPALQYDHRLRFLDINNDQLLAYIKTTPDFSNVIVIVVNLDPHHPQEGHVVMPLHALGLEPELSYQMHDLLSDARYTWQGASNYIRLDPQVCPAHIFKLRRKIKTERDFDYFG